MRARERVSRGMRCEDGEVRKRVLLLLRWNKRRTCRGLGIGLGRLPGLAIDVGGSSGTQSDFLPRRAPQSH
jgi:hypothetical protein